MSGVVAQNINRHSGLIKAPSGGGAWNFIKKISASDGDATISFVNGSDDVVLDDTYKEYVFYCVNMHPENDGVLWTFNASDDTSSHAYDITKTSTFFWAYHNESDTNANFEYEVDSDKGQSTEFQVLTAKDSAGDGVGNDNDQSCSGYIHLYNPGSTTFVKHFHSRFNQSFMSNYTSDNFVSGYFNTTAAITAIQFKFLASGGAASDTDAGDIFLHGLTT